MSEARDVPKCQGCELVVGFNEGFIYFNALGGFDEGIIPGRKVRIHTKQGTILGVVGRKAIHLIEARERDKASKLHDLTIDIGAKDKKEVEKIIEIGDPFPDITRHIESAERAGPCREATYAGDIIDLMVEIGP